LSIIEPIPVNAISCPVSLEELKIGVLSSVIGLKKFFDFKTSPLYGLDEARVSPRLLLRSSMCYE
jgi:hypothetical protein